MGIKKAVMCSRGKHDWVYGTMDMSFMVAFPKCGNIHRTCSICNRLEYLCEDKKTWSQGAFGTLSGPNDGRTEVNSIEINFGADSGVECAWMQLRYIYAYEQMPIMIATPKVKILTGERLASFKSSIDNALKSFTDNNMPTIAEKIGDVITGVLNVNAGGLKIKRA